MFKSFDDNKGNKGPISIYYFMILFYHLELKLECAKHFYSHNYKKKNGLFTNLYKAI